MTYVKSEVDEKFYLVRNSPDEERASNMLARMHRMIIEFSDKLELEKNKYPEYKPYIESLHSKAKNIVLVESTQDSKNTSYSVDKGEKIVFCLRTKRTGDVLHDENLVTYVVLHEISHVACPEYGHGQLFQKIFAFLTQRAIEMGYYRKIDFNVHPEEYCGITINESIV